MLRPGAGGAFVITLGEAFKIAMGYRSRDACSEGSGPHATIVDLQFDRRNFPPAQHDYVVTPIEFGDRFD